MRHIAIIDDGVNEKYFKNDVILKYNIEITKDLEIVERTNYDRYSRSHGTICAGIIKKYAAGIDISSIKILHSNHNGLCEQLIKAINWCMENHVHIVNMSLGTTRWEDFLKLKSVFSRAADRNVILVAANNNKGLVTYPAAMSSVLGVKANVCACIDAEEFSYNGSAFNGIEIECNGYHMLDLHTGGSIFLSPSNSYAAAYATSVLSGIADANNLDSLKSLKGYLSEYYHSNRHLPDYTFRNFDWIEKVLIFNFYQEKFPVANLIPIFNKCHTVTNIMESFNEICVTVLQYLHNNTELLDSFDTIIIISRCKDAYSTDISFSNLCNFLNEHGLNLLFFDENVKIDNRNLSASHTNRISCYDDYFFNKHLILDKKFNNPIISVFDFTNEYLLEILSNLFFLFRKNGYDVAGVTNNKLAVMLGMEHTIIDAEHTAENASFVYQTGAMHNSDIVVNGMSVEISFFDNIKSSNGLIGEDMLIFVFNSINEAILRQFKDSFTNSKIIILYRNNQCEYNYNFAFDLGQINYKLLFEYIVNSFEEGECNYET